MKKAIGVILMISGLASFQTAALAGGIACQAIQVKMDLEALINDGKLEETKTLAQEQMEVIKGWLQLDSVPKYLRPHVRRMVADLKKLKSSVDLLEAQLFLKKFSTSVAAFAQAVVAGPKVQQEASSDSPRAIFKRSLQGTIPLGTVPVPTH